jgi:malate dehydrogenase (oxaloacetate-decarboxylating)(NADP+)
VISEEMKLACVKALADLAQAEPSEVVAKAYGGEAGRFGPEYLIPRPFDPRLILELAPAVAQAAMDGGVATRPIADFEAYRQGLRQFVFRSGLIMKPIFDRAAGDPKRVIYAEGEDERVLRAVQVLVDDGLAKPILVGRPEVIAARIERLGLRVEAGRDFEIVNPESDPRYNTYWQAYHGLMGRTGVSPDRARTVVRTNATVIAALAVHLGDADAMLCGVEGRYYWHLERLGKIIGLAEEAHNFSALSVLILPSGTFFLADTYVSPDPSATEIAEMTVLAAAHLRRFGIEPRIALLSHSSFGSRDTASAIKMRAAIETLHAQHPELDVEGEMHADAALDEAIRNRIFPNSRLSGPANLLIMPNLDAANIAFNLVKSVGEGLPVGPILIGAKAPAHILSSSVTARGVVNMSAIAVVDAQGRDQD